MTARADGSARPACAVRVRLRCFWAASPHRRAALTGKAAASCVDVTDAPGPPPASTARLLLYRPTSRDSKLIHMSNQAQMIFFQIRSVSEPHAYARGQR